MRLVLFTAYYPYDGGEEFIISEMKTAEKMFDEILLVSYVKPPLILDKYVPENAKIITVRSNYSKLRTAARALSLLLRKSVISEIRREIKNGESRGKAEIIKSVLASELAISCYEENQSKWISDEPSIYCSYWLDGSATYLARNRDKLGGLCVSRTHRGDCFDGCDHHAYRKQQLEGLDYILPISEAGREDLLKQADRLGVEAEEKIKVFRLGTLDGIIGTNPANISEEKHIVTCSSILPVKRLDLMIDALARIDGINILWTHLGGGSYEDEIKNLAKSKLSGKPNIRYEFLGQMLNENVLAYYASSPVDLLVNCSDSEGIPVSVMESMCFGIPAVARDVGGNCELVDDDTGILLPRKEDTLKLAEAITEILTEDDGKKQKRRKAASDKVRSLYSAEKNYRDFYNFLIMKSGVTE